MKTVLDLCSGISGFTLGLIHSGLYRFYQVTQFVEINPECTKILRSRFPDVAIHDDIKTLSLTPGQYDIIIGSPPCQPHSLAAGNRGGGRKGRADKRDLGDEFIRLIREGKPEGFICEEVPGFYTTQNGEYFKAFVSKLTALGYEVNWGYLKASQVGAVHYRRRLWIMGVLSASESPVPVFELSLIKRKNSSSSSCNWFTQAKRLQSQLEVSLLTHDKLEDNLGIACDTTIKRDRATRLRMLGNAIVPQVASKIWQQFHDCLLSKPDASFLALSEKAPSPLPFYLPTPVASDGRLSSARKWNPGSHKHLAHALIPWRVKETNTCNDRLTPEFVEAMMGFPAQWTHWC